MNTDKNKPMKVEYHYLVVEEEDEGEFKACNISNITCMRGPGPAEPFEAFSVEVKLVSVSGDKEKLIIISTFPGFLACSSA